MTANTHTPHNDNEIDLTELLLKLWLGRWALAISTLAGLTLASLYAVSAPQVWVSSATIAPPSYEQMGDYYLVKTQLNSALLLLPTADKTSTPPPPADADKSISISEQLFDSAQLLLETTQGLKLLRPDGRKQQLFQVQADAANPTEALQNLTQGLASVNRRLTNSMTREIRSQLALLQHALRTEQDTIARQASSIRKQQLTSTRLALDSAKRAGLTQFAGSNYAGLDNDDMRYLLGSKLLQARLTTLEQATPEYPARYYEITTQLTDIQKLPPFETGNLAGFQLVTAPTLPDQPNSPKKMLIIGLGMIGGLLLGCFWTLSRGALTGLQAKLQNLR